MHLLLAFLAGQDLTVLDSGHRQPKTVKDPAQYFWIADAESLKAFWKQEQARGEPPDLDFKDWIVLALFPGIEADRHKLTIESAAVEKGSLVLRFSLTPTGVEGGPGLHFPYAFVKIRRMPLPVRIVECPKGKDERLVRELDPPR